ncbi:SWIM zinc finger family protein [uncultured Alistipes sp.]|uniref:SWIM zinc finger family protein n=1 Tax=uncultured Alistipes sp. TaxID=538949 RepID=UPI00343FEE99
MRFVDKIIQPNAKKSCCDCPSNRINAYLCAHVGTFLHPSLLGDRPGDQHAGQRLSAR